MAHIGGEGLRPAGARVPARLEQRLRAALAEAGPALLFALRVWASVCLALYVAFWLQLSNADWAGTTAFIVCQPQLGASLRKGWFRLIGTVIGAVAIVVLTALFPQDRFGFLGILALWGAVCAFAAMVLRNFASYAAALAGYTAVIVAADTLGATGGPSSDVFMLAVMRASEICVGIVSAGVVLAGTDLGGARRQLAALIAGLTAEIAGRFTDMLAHAGEGLPSTQPARHALMRRAIALDPIIDQALGEVSQLRYHSPTLQRARYGLFAALDGWRGVATRLEELSADAARQEAGLLRANLPARMTTAAAVPGAAARWTDDPVGLWHVCIDGARALLALPARTPSARLLADQTAKLLGGLAQVLAGLALLVDARDRPHDRTRRFVLSVPDVLPALVSAARAFLAIGAMELLWVVTAWPSGAVAVVFTAVLVLLFSPRGDAAYAGAVAFTAGSAIGIALTATIKFAVLPGLETFAALSLAIGLYLVPLGFGLAYSRRPAVLSVLMAIGIGFVPLLAPANPMTYDTAQFYNMALAVFAGSAAASLAFALLPPPSPAVRTRRLLALTLRDLRRCATVPAVPRLEDWEQRMYGRLAALPEACEGERLSQLLVAFSAGSEVIRLRRMAPDLALGRDLDAALFALAGGDRATARLRLALLDHRLAGHVDGEPDATLALRARASILALSEALARQAGYFDARAGA